MSSHIQQEELEPLIRAFEEGIPFNRFLGLRCLDVRPGRVVVELPYRRELIGNPEVPALHGGAISATLDTAGGLAVWSKVGPAGRVSTIDLRVDYLRPGREEPLIALAEVVRVGNRVGVAQLRAYHRDVQDRFVAAGMGVYSIRRSEGEDTDTVGEWSLEDAETR